MSKKAKRHPAIITIDTKHKCMMIMQHVRVREEYAIDPETFIQTRMSRYPLSDLDMQLLRNWLRGLDCLD